MATDVLVETDFKKKNGKNPVCETVVWSLVDCVKNLIEKKWLGLSDSDVASGGLSVEILSLQDRKIYWEGSNRCASDANLCISGLCCSSNLPYEFWQDKWNFFF